MGGAKRRVALRPEPCGLIFRTLLRTMEGILNQCFANGSAGYRREILAYVEPWSSLQTRVKTPTVIWPGGHDSWTPPIMSERLATLLPNAERHLLPELGHYGALQHALHAICAYQQR
ncbi:hypothetical protein [Hyphomicrobium sp. D-2]|uniref:alpha/beta fold hydrolase n=1 Tax=Hyphomicrobium sp. D-2 TaxID=3041621 RepID=UPI002453E296|nr:hypothetical protein [Hyphomicrobium sp. D-2]MDH4983150.1 hypothetical protein [Hyphomicrobium sp. D-2]